MPEELDELPVAGSLEMDETKREQLTAECIWTAHAIFLAAPEATYCYMSENEKPKIYRTGEATGFLPARDSNGKPITVIATPAIEETFDEKCLEQALNSRGAPGVTNLVLNPDAHCGYGAPVGC